MKREVVTWKTSRKVSTNLTSTAEHDFAILDRSEIERTTGREAELSRGIGEVCPLARIDT